jgi:hypothetical protein
MTKTSFIAGCLGAGLLLSVSAGPVSHQPWVRHSSFEDFSRGTLADGGANLYVSRAGTVEMIHRWDLNNDGFLDLFVGQDHNQVESEDVLIYRGGPRGFRSLLPDLPDQQPLGRLLSEIRKREAGVTRLPSKGGGRSLLEDLNQDGYLDLVFCNFIHNYGVETDAMIYWGSREGFRPDRRTLLPTLLGSAVTAADFNRDGFVDLAIANHGIEGWKRFGTARHLESYIYWNGPTGFSSGRRAVVPSISALDVASGDMNRDGFPELLLVNNNSEEKSVYLYWGGPGGFSVERRDRMEGGDPVGIRLADLDRDGALDLVVTHRDDRAQLFKGGPRGLPAEPWMELPTAGAVRCEVAELNRDGFPDLILANRGERPSTIYWGGSQGFESGRRTDLPTLDASDAVAVDFNRDGWTDLAFANEGDSRTHDVPSYIYWNGPRGFDPAHRSHLQGFGPVSLQGADLDRDGWTDLVLVNRNSGSRDAIDSLIYWGNPRHHYSAASVSRVPGAIGAVPAIADLNRDGWTDIAFPNGWIYWGHAEGYGARRREDLKLEEGHGASTADLNRDGYLDLVIPAGSAYSQEGSSRGILLWGGEDGFHSRRRTELSLNTNISQSAAIADLNKDGFLDLIFPDVDRENVDLFWGSPGGDYGRDNHTLLKVHSASTVEIADLNADGWLDLILGGVYDMARHGRPMRHATLVWGGAEGFDSSRSLRLEAYESEEQSVADLDKDGYLDIVMTNYHAYTTRKLPCFIYWGGPEGYSESRRTGLPGESTLALTVADLNRDGWMDIVPFNHLRDGDHGVGTNIFWGSPQGFSYSRRHWFQTFGPHFSVRHDVGNIYDRRLEEEFRSPLLGIPPGKRPSRLDWRARTPHGTAVKFQLRSGSTPGDVRAAAWAGPNGPGAHYGQPSELPPPPPDHRWLQYRALLTTPDGGSTPVLEEVSLEVSDG